MDSKTVAIIGGGAWGTALAQALARGGHSVTIWALEQDVTDSINNEHENKHYLVGYSLEKSIRADSDIVKVASGKDFIIIATPSLFLSDTVKKLTAVPDVSDGKACVAVITKGFVPSNDGAKLVLETIENILPGIYKGCTVYISGPSHAEEVALGKITGLIAACENPRNSIKIRELLRVPGILAFSSFDVIGVQVCAAAKNIIAVVYGMADALAETSDLFGDNATSLLMAAGLNEIQTLGFAMGATHAQTFASIAGIGDLDVTCKSIHGRNRRFGQDIIKKNCLSQFKNLDDIILNMKKLGYLSEGAVACKYVHEIAKKKNIKLTICDGLYRILNKEIAPKNFMKELLHLAQEASHA